MTRTNIMACRMRCFFNDLLACFFPSCFDDWIVSNKVLGSDVDRKDLEMTEVEEKSDPNGKALGFLKP